MPGARSLVLWLACALLAAPAAHAARYTLDPGSSLEFSGSPATALTGTLRTRVCEACAPDTLVFDPPNLESGGVLYPGGPYEDIEHEGFTPVLFVQIADGILFDEGTFQAFRLRLSLEKVSVVDDLVTFRFLELAGAAGSRETVGDTITQFDTTGTILEIFETFEIVREVEDCFPVICFPNMPGLFRQGDARVENVLGSFTLQATVPEPDRGLLLAAGLTALAAQRRVRRFV